MYNTALQEIYNSYKVVIDLIVLFSLVIKHNKSKISYFSKTYNKSSLELDLLLISVSTLKFKTCWRYLDFYFD